MLRQRHFGGRAPAIIFGLALLVAVPLAAAHAFDAKKADLSIIRVVVFEIKNGKRTGTYSFGTGFVVANEYVVTNNHVTDDSDFTKDGGSSERVVVDGSTKNLRPAQLIWNSTELDLAVVRVPGLTRPSLTLSSAPPMEYPEKAAAVWAIGFPGLADRSITSETAFSMSTITQGVVGKVVMGRASQRDKVRPVIQHNASINKGNSGGPLFDNCGLVVGVNTFGAVSTMEVSRDQKGRDIAAGMPNTGIFYSPHIGNFIEAQKTVAALAPIKLTLSAAPCTAAVAEPPGLPVWVYGIIGVVALLALTSTFVAFRKGTTREIVRVVESYSAYIRRKGEPPSVRAHKAERSRTAERGVPSNARSRTAPPHVAEAAAPVGASKLVLTGRSKEQSFRVEIGADELEAASAKSDRGVVLGRSRSLSDKVVDDPSISRRHAKFFLADGMLMVEDMGSAYGTKINGKKLGANEAGALKPGDKLGIGGVTLEVGRAVPKSSHDDIALHVFVTVAAEDVAGEREAAGAVRGEGNPRDFAGNELALQAERRRVEAVQAVERFQLQHHRRAALDRDLAWREIELARGDAHGARRRAGEPRLHQRGRSEARRRGQGRGEIASSQHGGAFRP